MQFYWELIERDGAVTYVPPTQVDAVRRLWKDRQPIPFPTRTVVPGQIVTFRVSTRPFGEQPLVEAAAHAFNEPLYVEAEGIAGPEQAVQSRWVKKPIPQYTWDKYYSASPGYRRLGDSDGMVVVAFVLPVHAIDLNKVQHCNPAEVQQLNQR